MSGPRIAVIGATGAVGRVLLRLLEERSFPASAVRLCASRRSWGKKVRLFAQDLTVEEPTERLLGEVDIVFIAAGSDRSLELAPVAARQGALVIDKSSAFRMDPEVPLVVTEVNPGDLEWHAGIVSVPNCTTTPLVMALKPLNDVVPVRRVVVDSYQAVSGAGAAAVEELRRQSGEILDDRPAEARVFPHQIAFNVLPQVESFMDNGYTTEEMKLVHETRKIMHLPGLPVSATCVRVPVMVGHSEAVHVEFNEPFDAADVREVLSRAPGVRVVHDPSSGVYPTPIDAEGGDDVLVGRIRQDASHPRGVAMWLSCDNLRKGAALNAIQIAELAMNRDLLKGRRESSRAVGTEAADAQPFDSAREYYEANLDEFVAHYEGLFVAIIDGRVVDSDTEFAALAGRVYRTYGYRDIFMPRVQREPEIVHVRSPKVISSP